MKNQAPAADKTNAQSLLPQSNGRSLLFTSDDSNSISAQRYDGRFEPQIEDCRLKRVPGYCVIAAAGFGAFGLVYGFVGAYFSAAVCIVATLMHWCMFSVMIRRPDTNRYFANIHLALSTIGLTLDALVSGLQTSTSIGFLCCVCLISAHQSGWRVALGWALICVSILAVLCFGCDPDAWPMLREHSLVLDFVAVGGLFLILTWMAVQSERSASDAYRVSLEKSEQLNLLAQRDQLTSLANRHRFRAELEIAKSNYQQNGGAVGLVLFDLDFFKDVNDTFGHLAGDHVLQAVADRLNRVLQPQQIVARLGGDEFAVVTQSVSLEELKQLGDNIAAAVAQPIAFGSEKIRMSSSVGLASLPEHATCIDELIGYADLAAYHAKATSGNQVELFCPQMLENRERRGLMVEKLNAALEHDELALVYQPQVNVSTGQIIGVEALLRWNPRDGSKPVSPAEFVPILESSGLIQEVGQWVLEESCARISDWRSRGLDCVVSVNVSPVQFHNPNFVQDVLGVIQNADIPPSNLDLEITEGVMLDNPNEAEIKLRALKRIGVTISVDDFGTGYSSLAYLKHLSLDRLKIDRVFIKDIPEHDDGSLASSIVSLADMLGLSVLAEGVETEQQLAFLKQVGCDDYQGYFFSKPVSARRCTQLLMDEQLKREATDRQIDKVCKL